MKYQELLNHDLTTLISMAQAAQEKLQSMRIDHCFGLMNKNHLIRIQRKDVARLMTLISQKDPDKKRRKARKAAPKAAPAATAENEKR